MEANKEENTWDPQSPPSPDDYLGGHTPERRREASETSSEGIFYAIHDIRDTQTSGSEASSTPLYFEPLDKNKQDGANSSAADSAPKVKNNEVGEQVLPTAQAASDASEKHKFLLPLMQDTAAGSSTAKTQPPEEVEEGQLAVMTASLTEYQDIVPPAFRKPIGFTFQKIRTGNFEGYGHKCYAIRFMLKTEYIPWMAQYLLKDYIVDDMSCHHAFSHFLDHLEIPAFSEAVLEQTFRIIQILLTCDWTRTNSTERTVLNKLGHWLGLVTLGKDRPILQIKLDLQELLQTADLKGENALLCIVPFIVKIMESCSQSKVFRPPNPWTMRILNTLSILRRKYRLSFRLDFDTSFLLQNLGVEF